MKLLAMSVFDKKVGTYSPPFFVPHMQVGVRSIADAISAKDTALSKYPGDFALYKLAEFDDSSGDISTCRPAELVAEVAGLIKEKLQ